MAPKKLLVADDSLTIQKVIRLALSGAAAAGSSSEGYEIQAVSDGNDAIQQISLFRPDVVLIDVSLPGKSAFEVKRAINEHRDLDDVRFILMSSAFEKVDEPQVTTVHFHGRLTKPFDPAHLREVISQVIATVPPKSKQSTGKQQKTSMPELPPAEEPRFEPSFEMPPTPPSAFPDDDKTPIRDYHSLPGMGGPSSSSDLPLSPPPLPGDDINDFRLSSSGSGFDLPPALPDEPHTELPSELPPAMPNFERTNEIPLSMESPHDDLPQMGENTDSDIKNLTESTIRMSGLDDFQWSVQEHSLKPPSGLTDSGDTSFPLAPAPSTSRDQRSQERAPLPPPSYTEYKSTLDEEEEAHSISNHADQLPFPPVSMEEIEEIIRREVEKSLQKIAQKILPDVAERIIKEEIHKLLGESP